MPRETRLYDLIQIMRDGRLHTAAGLARELGVSERTIWRDMATLAETGLPIEGERGLGYILRTPLVLPPVPLTQDELSALVAGLSAESRSADPDRARAAASLLDKVATLLPQAGIAQTGEDADGRSRGM